MVENINACISTYENSKIGELELNPLQGTVIVGSGVLHFGFSLG
jgi:hypothetical protein